MRILTAMSFRLKLVLGAVVCVAFVQTCAQSVEILKENARMEQRLAARSNTIADLVVNLVALPMWDFNFPALKNILQGLSADTSVISAMLMDQDGRKITGWESAPGVFSIDELVVTRPVRSIEKDSSEIIGRLELRFRRTEIARQIRQAMIQKILTGIVMLLMTGLSLYVVLTHISEPLVRLVAVIGRIRSGDLAGRVPGTARRDEIGKVAKALERLRRNESEMRLLRADQDEQTRRERHRIVRALQSTDDAVLLVDETGTVAFQNDRARDYCGEVKKGQMFDASAFVDADVAEDITRGIALGLNLDLVATIRRPATDESRDLRIRVDPILDETGGVLGTVLLGSDTTEAERQKRRADHIAHHDSLTDLPNRRRMEETLGRWIEQEGREAAVLLCDLDRFKQINDTLGHPTGDRLLRHVAGIIRDLVSLEDLPVRLGGDEFAILAHGPGCRARAARFADALIAAMSVPVAVEKRTLQSGMSIGIAVVPAGAHTAAEAVQMADLALYEAKRTGRGRACIFREELQRDARRKTFIEDALRAALAKKGQIRPVFQRQTDLATGRITGFEALARWTHPEAGAISPGEFIPVAEEAGLIEALTTEILFESFRVARMLAHQGFEGRVAVNISPRLFSGNVVELVTDALIGTGCPAHAIEIEITEQVVLDSGPRSFDEIARLRALGVTVALDDFGVGFSSLSYLQRFPVDKIKIDRAFVSNLVTSADTRAIVLAIVQLGHALRMSVTGEGAETEADRAALREAGADRVQGWVDGMPVGAEQAMALVTFEARPCATPRVLRAS